MPPADPASRAGVTPKASGDRSSRTFAEEMTTPLSGFIEILERVAGGTLSCAEAQSLLEKNPLDDFPGSEAITSELHHYWSDEDIRQRDSGYRLMQDEELSKLINRLRHGAYGDAARITFLHVS